MRALILFACLTAAIEAGAQGGNYVAKDLTPEKQFTHDIEGPATAADGTIYLVNIEKNGTIASIGADGKAKLFVELPNGSVGNGMRINKKGDMFIADVPNHNVLVIKKGTKKVEVYAHEPSMNQPNDLAMAPNGTIYASDPNWKNNTGNLWKVAKGGKVTLLEKDMGTTNGVEVSPDGRKLYVNESIQRKIWVYDIDKNGDVHNKRLFYSFDDFGLDGMRCDVKGNLYVCRYDKGTVAIFSPQGKLLREVQLKGKQVSNITFAGKDRKTCYVTLQDRGCVEYFRSEFRGRE